MRALRPGTWVGRGGRGVIFSPCIVKRADYPLCVLVQHLPCRPDVIRHDRVRGVPPARELAVRPLRVQRHGAEVSVQHPKYDPRVLHLSQRLHRLRLLQSSAIRGVYVVWCQHLWCVLHPLCVHHANAGGGWELHMPL